MYSLYFLPGACSLAVQVVLRELGQSVKLINIQQTPDFTTVNPVGTVPVLIDRKQVYREGAAIILHLLFKHPNSMLPKEQNAQARAIENIMFANATMHPAYSRLFFIAQNIQNDAVRQAAFDAAANTINHLWGVLEQQLHMKPFLGGDKPSAADIMLTVYSRWGESFPVQITIGPEMQKVIDHVLAMPNFKLALNAEQEHQ